MQAKYSTAVYESQVQSLDQFAKQPSRKGIGHSSHQGPFVWLIS
jgi:hypothetical protein